MKKLFAVAALALLAAGAAQAQTASITATAIVAGPLTLTNTGNLDFGTVIPGTPRTIDPTISASAGSFSLGGGSNAQISLTWTFPQGAFLVDASANPLPVTYTAVYNTASVQSGAGVLNLAGDTRRLSAPGGQGYVWVGGTVSPAAVGQAFTTYTATVQLSAAYTGN
jgi:hypothetical protein